MTKFTNGKLIRKLRIQKGLTQEQLGLMLGVKKSAIQKYENGNIQNLKLETIRKLCLIFQIPAFTFVFEEDLKDQDIRTNKDLQGIIRTCYGEETLTIFLCWSSLNSQGTAKLCEYVKDISEIERYRKGES